MNENSAKIEAALGECERAIRDIIATAAQAGDYETVDLGREVALEVSTLRSNSSGVILQNQMSPAPTVPKPPNKAKRKRSPKSSKYPRFEVSGNNLIRYGWSKKEKDEYSHKVSKEVFDHILHAISQIGAINRGPHTAESIIDHANKEADELIPNYQVYAILGFLKAKNTIEQQGREGYLIPADFAQQIEGHWR
ncbi:MAG: hypothetical protein GY849_15545 [Deltaproteobacteria bacterium]|nr:hypothetical protein [Deltaproteobacteria bacterium]